MDQIVLMGKLLETTEQGAAPSTQSGRLWNKHPVING